MKTADLIAEGHNLIMKVGLTTHFGESKCGKTIIVGRNDPVTRKTMRKGERDMEMPRRKRCSMMLAAVIGVLVALAAHGECQGQVLPKIVEDGFDAYQTEGAEAAVKKWLTGSPMAGTQEAAVFPAQFKQLEAIYGPYRGYEAIQVRQLSTSTKVVFLIVKYDRGPAFGWFSVYNRGAEEWIIPQLGFHTKAEFVIPPAVLWGTR